MSKEALRVKRYYSPKRGRNRASRPRTFKTEEAAKQWAETQGLKEYSLRNLRNEESSTKKIRVEPK